MRISSISLENVPPLRLFSVGKLSDVVVFAGPNGVGKTRLIKHLISYLQKPNLNQPPGMTLQATCPEKEQVWGKNDIDTASTSDLQSLRTLLQQKRRRNRWKSSVLYFESNRTIQKIEPYRYTWEISDPYDEEVAWQSTFSGLSSRFQDTVHAIFRLIECQKRGIANRAIQLRREGKSEMGLQFDDPLEPFAKVFDALVGPKELFEPNPRDQTLRYKSNNEVFKFNTLSSGELEVVQIAFDFLLRDPSDCIVFFDEPELHLHPELASRLIRALQGIGERNQFIFCTHSPDIISSALDHSVVFIAPPTSDGSSQVENQAHPVREDDDTNQALRLLGHSVGVISLGKRIVLIEGTNSSLDKRVYGSIIGNRYPELVLVPSKGKDVIRSFETIAEEVLSRTLWGVEFFMLCDRDAMPSTNSKAVELGKGKLRLLERYHLENYFLDENIWALIFQELDGPNSQLCSPEGIRKEFLAIARNVVSYSAALSVSAVIRSEVGNVDLLPKGCDRLERTELIARLEERCTSEHSRVSMNLEKARIRSLANEHFGRIHASLDEDSEVWKCALPGRPILNKFLSSIAKLDLARGKNLYLRKALSMRDGPFCEIDSIFRSFAEYAPRINSAHSC